ncbi:hypothetical protein D3C76_1026320 [compost metagenome]
MLQAVDAGIQDQLRAFPFGFAEQRLQVGVAVDDAGAWREQGGDAPYGRLQGMQAGGIDFLQVMHTTGRGVDGEAVQLGALGVLHRHQQLADALVRHVVGGAPGVQAFAAFQAEFGLQRAGRVIEAGVDDFGIATGCVAADQAFLFDHQHAASGIGQARGAGQAERAGADDQQVYAVHSSVLLQLQVRPGGQRLGFQMAGWRAQQQGFAGFAGEAPALVEQTLADAAPAGDLAHAQARQAPGVVVAFQPGGAEQAVVEASAEQPAFAQPGLHQRGRVGMRCEQPVRGVGVDLQQVLAVLFGGLDERFDDHGHGGFLGVGRQV